MLLPSGRCYSHYRVVWVGRCYCHCRWNSQGSFIFYLSLSSEMLARTSSQTCGRWYLPTFLFKDGSLTLMYIASLIVLIWFKSSLPTISKLLMVTWWPLMLLWSCMGDGESRDLFRRLERLQLKMADFQNHRRFTLRCLDEEVIPVSIKA